MPIFIDKIQLPYNTAIAPMEGITDAAFRKLLRRLGGCGLSVTEFVNCEALTRDVRRIWAKAEVYEDERPASVQIYGRKVESLAKAAAMCEERGAQIIDLNLGCPAKQVVAGNAGSALMREPELCSEIFQAVESAISIPFTVKMRLGWDSHSLNAVDIATRAQDAGAKMVVVHGRTRAEAYRGKARWDMVAPVVEALKIPVMVNGDILTLQDARDALKQSKAQGIMVGRGLLRNPWLLRQISDEAQGREIYSPCLDERLHFIFEYMELLQDSLLSPTAVLGRVKCFVGYFTRALAYASQMRQQAYRSRDLEELRGHLLHYFDALKAEKLDDIFDRHVTEGQDPNLREGDPRSF
ncbi:MAG: tRNA dihydrouridine synthase [Bradymonadia bacterium]|jgi:tRNA-dihydrouridine synthase B